MTDPTCCTCDRSADQLPNQVTLHKCPNPRCDNWICSRHGLLYEIHDELESRLDYYCSRQCWNEQRKRSLPTSKELVIFAIVLFIALPLYLYVVSIFV